MASYFFTGDEACGGIVRTVAERAGFAVVDDVREADVAVSLCTSLRSLEDCYFDEGGLVKCAEPGTLLVDLSAATPALSREIAAISQVSDLRFVEAPLAVVDPVAADALSNRAHLRCFAGGEAEDVEEARELLELLAAEVVFTGAVGSAQLAKACHTARLSARIVGEVEACALARSAAGGMPDGAQALLAGADRSIASALRAPAFDGQYTVALFMADVAAAMTCADDVDLILPQLECALHLLELIAVIGGADLGVAALSLLFDEEEASARAGLDWTRAEGLFADGADEADEDEEWGGSGGFAGAFGGYSFN